MTQDNQALAQALVDEDTQPRGLTRTAGTLADCLAELAILKGKRAQPKEVTSG